MERDDLKAPLLDPPPAAASEVATTAAEGETGAPPPPHPPPPPPPPPPAVAYKGATSAAKGKSALADDAPPPPPPPLPPPPPAAAYKGATSAAKGKSALADDAASAASSTPPDSEPSSSGGHQETHQDVCAQVVGEGTGGRTNGEQSRGWPMWLLRRSPPTSPTLPVTQPRQSGDSRAKKFRDWLEPNLGEMLPDSLVTKRLAAFGFVLYGVVSILSNTPSLMKDAGVSVGLRRAVLLCVGLIWILASIGVPCTLFGRSRLEHHVSQHTAHLGLLGITLLISLHIGWMLPNNFWRPDGDYLSFWSAGGFVFLLSLGVIGHVASWAVSLVSGEESTKPSASA